jgi:uncharacterized membrane protein YgaE (UPF0421/DUF939 family)
MKYEIFVIVLLVFFGVLYLYKNITKNPVIKITLDAILVITWMTCAIGGAFSFSSNESLLIFLGVVMSFATASVTLYYLIRPYLYMVAETHEEENTHV